MSGEGRMSRPIIFTDSQTVFRCTCPLTDDPNEEIELAMACAERERAWIEACRARPAADGGAS